uniref:Uncharacterized protein n=1 Tax=Opuntia streptacantha TaxID=393608 RepID=A0A7C9AIL6_OPUST
MEGWGLSRLMLLWNSLNQLLLFQRKSQMLISLAALIMEQPKTKKVMRSVPPCNQHWLVFQLRKNKRLTLMTWKLMGLKQMRSPIEAPPLRNRVVSIDPSHGQMMKPRWPRLLLPHVL